ncbi:zinc-binding dehydrogenase [Marinigracilibium pacificum]|uniref:Zinc-binding dehydrogenase n=1 Tax=Marinigracilibium pacificum TaxID=2729599 RepID=A0A848J1B2_9BACT|nr:zinc-binding dehydrogenase [Marinigracilibium pacificum]NMM48089.1 zinc-binding dehydrogenase [Marinigracilibium pacificum]
MKAIEIQTLTENKVVLSEKNKPTASDSEVIIKGLAAALNHRDQYIREGLYPGIKDGVTLGSDLCGVVIESPSDSSLINKRVIVNPNRQWGDSEKAQSKDYHIMGLPTDGALAEFTKVPIDKIFEAPQFLSDEECAALPLAGMTAYRALFYHGQAEKGQKVLVTGIGGGVAQFAAQFALAQNCDVFVTTSSEVKASKFKELGVKNSYNYKDENWYKALISDTNGGVDLVIDSAGGDLMNTYIKCTKPGGKIVFYGASAGKTNKFDLHSTFWKQITIQGSTMGSDEEFTKMIDFVNKHKIHPIIDNDQFTLDTAIDAFDKMKSGKQFGKLVIKLT